MAARATWASRVAGGAAVGLAAVGLVVAAAPVAVAQPAVEVAPAEGLAAGDTVTVTGAGFDPQAGYYVSTCVAGTSGPAGPTCVGGAASREGSVWVSNSPQAAGVGTPIAQDGTFTAQLVVATTAEGVDCAVDECAVTVFLDHRNGFGVVSETPVTFAAAAPADTAPTTGSSAAGSSAAGSSEAGDALSEVEAAEEGDPNRVVRWVVFAAVGAAIGGGFAVWQRRRRT